MTVQMNFYTCYPFNPISGTGIYESFKLDCDINPVEESAVVSPIYLVFERSEATALNARPRLNVIKRNTAGRRVVKEVIYLSTH